MTHVVQSINLWECHHKVKPYGRSETCHDAPQHKASFSWKCSDMHFWVLRVYFHGALLNHSINTHPLYSFSQNIIFKHSKLSEATTDKKWHIKSGVIFQNLSARIVQTATPFSIFLWHVMLLIWRGVQYSNPKHDILWAFPSVLQLYNRAQFQSNWYVFMQFFCISFHYFTKRISFLR